MPKKTKKLIFKKSAPQEIRDGVEIQIGTSFKRHFKQADEPFQLDRNYANVILRSYDYFQEFEEVPAPPSKPEDKTGKLPAEDK